MLFSIDTIRECLLASLAGAALFVPLFCWAVWMDKRGAKRVADTKGINGEGI